MDVEISLAAGGTSETRKLRLEPAESTREQGGQFRFSLNGSAESQLADWTEIAPGVYSLILGSNSYDVRVIARRSSTPGAPLQYVVSLEGREYGVDLRDPRSRRQAGSAAGIEGPQDILAPMPGRIVKILVQQNQHVDAGEGLVVIEAMKMQNELRAPRPGRVESVHVTEGVGVEAGIKLLRLL